MDDYRLSQMQKKVDNVLMVNNLVTANYFTILYLHINSKSINARSKHSLTNRNYLIKFPSSKISLQHCRMSSVELIKSPT